MERRPAWHCGNGAEAVITPYVIYTADGDITQTGAIQEEHFDALQLTPGESIMRTSESFSYLSWRVDTTADPPQLVRKS